MNQARVDLLAEILRSLRAADYHFVTPTPATHGRVIARRGLAQDVRDVFGWSLPFDVKILDPDLLAHMRAADALDERNGGLRSRVRVSSLGERLFLHSAYPTDARDAVFFGPDSYRFADFIARELPRFGPVGRLADIGAGSGVGAAAAMMCAAITELTLTDINPAALELARVNVNDALPAAKQRAAVHFVECSALEGVSGLLDVVIANPPYIVDSAHRAYRDGGGMHGAEISLTWAEAAAEKLKLGGALLLYTGSAIIDGHDAFKAALHEALIGFDISYAELDPDVFGEELERADYADVERIAVVGVVAVKR